ncbi:hypothetical protein [Cohnella sp. 56]|uniref:hypothetical protein n=1 Tax=Cohnella sp. 56 TaxID=3113722 RepID=UPI0030E85F47
MTFDTDWEALTYAYEGSITINYEPPTTTPNPGFSGDFEILPDTTLTYGDTFKLHPKDITTTGSCTFQSIKFRIERDGKVYTGSAIASKTTDDVYTLAKYPFVMAAGGSHDVYMQINTSCGSDWIGPQELYLMGAGTGGGGTTPTPTPTPTPGQNHPPTATIAWVKPGTTTPVSIVGVGSKVDLVITSMSDPDYPDDWVDVDHWDFTGSTNWLKTVPDSFGGNIKQNGYSNVTAGEIGQHKVALTVKDLKGATYTAYATLNVADSKPVAVIRGPSTVIEGRPLPETYNGALSYSSIGLKIVDYFWTNVQTKYMTPGTETITLKVKDEENHWSDVTSKQLNVLPDQPPIDTLAVPEQGTRLGSVTIQSGAYSPDYDNIVSHKIEMKYDAGNDGFANDAWQTVVNGNGDADSYTFTPSRVGKYLFQETVCEDWGRCGNTNSQPEAQRTLNVTNLAPVANVKTESDVLEPSAPTPILMADLFNNGRFFNLSNGNVGDKSSWKLENGVLKSKVLKPLANAASPHRSMIGNYEDSGRYTTNGTMLIRGTNDFEAYSTFGLENPVQMPFASMQSAPSFSQMWLPIDGPIIGRASDEKYTYIATRPSMSTGTLYAFDKAFNLKWSKAMPNAFYIEGEISRANYVTISSTRLLIHNGRLYVQMNDWNDSYKIWIQALDRDSGNLIAQTSYSWLTNFVGNMSGESQLVGLSDGVEAGGNKFDFNLNLLFNSSSISNRGAFKNISQTGYALANQGYLQPVYLLNTRNMQYMGGPIAQYNQLIPLGFDPAGNAVNYSSTENVILKVAPNGVVTKKALPQSEMHYYFIALGMDANGNVWFQDSLDTTYNVEAQTSLVVFDQNGTLLKRMFPFTDARIHIDYMFVGADNLVTLMGADNIARIKGGGTYKVHYSVIDPNNYSVVVSGVTPDMERNRVPSWIEPVGDQAFMVEYADSIANGNVQYLLKTTGAVRYPKTIDVGESAPTLITGQQVAANQTLKASLKAAAPDGRGTGIAFRIRDDRNYYSVEWEANELRVKKTVNGSASIVWNKWYPMVANQVYDVKIVPGDNTFDVYVNRILQATIMETQWTDGKFGIINRSQQDVSFLGASVEAVPAAYGKIEGIALVGQQVNYSFSYNDEENDPQLTAGNTWIYNHNPYVLLQPQGVASFSGQTLGAPVTTFSMAGDYSFTYRTKDDPQPEHRYPDGAFNSYRKDSNAVAGTIRVHRRPIADFGATWNGNGTITYTDASYDPDRYNPANGSYSTEATGINYQTTRGVLEYRYRYRAAGSTAYIEQKPTKLFGGTYVIELSVRDEYNAWSEWATQTIVAGGSAPLPPNPGFTIAPTTQYRFTNVTINSTASDPQDGTRENVEHAYYIQNLTTGGPESLQSDVRTSWTKQFNTLGVFQVRQVVINSFGLYAETSRNVSIVNRKPVVNITEPASANAAAPTMYNTLRPTMKWTYSDADGDEEKQYQLHFYKADGTFYRDSGELPGAALSWTPPTDFADGTTYYVYIRASDGMDGSDGWSGWAGPRFFRIETNKPPTADFSWTPTPVWEGDQIKLVPTVSDPDGDVLDVSFETESPTGAKRTYREQRAPPYAGAGPTFAADTPGIWKVRLSVSDGKAPAVVVAKTISVAPLGVSGRVLHTQAWEENRQRYNSDHPGKERPANWFWAGERFVLEASATDTGISGTKAAAVTAEAGPKLKAALKAVNSSRPIEWKGGIGTDEYGSPLEALPEGDYSFVFTAVYTNGVVKQATVVVHVSDTVKKYVNVHRIQ